MRRLEIALFHKVMGKTKHTSKEIRNYYLDKQKSEEKVLKDHLSNSKLRFKKFDDMVHAAYERRLPSSQFDARIDALIVCFSSSKRKYNHEYLRDFLLYLSKIKSKMIKHPELIKGIGKLCEYKSYWLIDLNDWKPKARNPYVQFDQLLELLFCKYEIPTFLKNSWLTPQEYIYLSWFIQLGKGDSVRKLRKMPIELTKKMAHHFSLAPKDFKVTEALRWAQTLGMGGNPQLAERIAHSKLSRNNFSNELFWQRFIQILVNTGMFNFDKINEIIDFLEQKLRGEEEFSLKGRTFSSLLNMSEEWHRQVVRAYFARPYRTKALTWDSCSLQYVSYVEGAKKKKIHFKFEELLSTQDLIAEGRAMNHCVGSYSSHCYQKKSAIFSLKKNEQGVAQERLGTIEINLSSRQIVQAKGVCNKVISQKAHAVLLRWAKDNTLSVSNYL